MERLGERQSAALGVGIVGVSAVLTGLAPTFVLAVIFRGAGGIGSALLFTSLTSYLLKIVPKDRMGRTLGLFYGAFNIGVIAGGPIGGEIAHLFGLASPLFFYAGILFVAGGLYLWLVPDPGAGVNRTESSDEPGPGIGALLRRREFQAAIVLNFAYLWIIGAAYDTLLPLFGNNVLGMTTQAIGVVVGIALAGELVVLYPTGWLMDRSGRRGVAVWSGARWCSPSSPCRWGSPRAWPVFRRGRCSPTSRRAARERPLASSASPETWGSPSVRCSQGSPRTRSVSSGPSCCVPSRWRWRPP